MEKENSTGPMVATMKEDITEIRSKVKVFLSGSMAKSTKVNG